MSILNLHEARVATCVCGRDVVVTNLPQHVRECVVFQHQAHLIDQVSWARRREGA